MRRPEHPPPALLVRDVSVLDVDAGALVPLKGRRRYARGAPPEEALPPAWVGLPGEVTCAACGELAHIPHPRFPEQERLEALQTEAGRGPRRRWRRG